MPLPNDPEIVKVAHELVNELQAIWGKHPGFRASAFAIFSFSHNARFEFSLLQAIPRISPSKSDFLRV